MCEWLLALVFGPVGLFVIFFSIHKWEGILIGLLLAVFAGAAGYCGFALVQQKEWSVRASFVIGIGTMAVGVEIIKMAMQPDQVNDSAYAGLLGIAMLVFALPALILLALPATRRYVRSEY